jgi:hypothetical protein
MESWIKALKVFVVVGAVVLVVGTATLIGLLVQRRAAHEAERPAAAGLRGDLALPAGSRIERIELDGTRALLVLRAADQQHYLALVNPATGERLSLLRIVPDPG